MNAQTPQQPKKSKFKGCFFALIALFLITTLYIGGLYWWTENTEAGQKHQSELNKEKYLASDEFLLSTDSKTQQQKIDSAKLQRQKEQENPTQHLEKLHKELENKNLTKTQRKEIEIEIKNIRSENWGKKNISGWDNSNTKLERAVKNVMNDENSFEHVSTTYSYEKDRVIAVMTYRGSNSFGAKVIEQVTGIFDYDGALLSVEKK